jgi:GntR family transcriptional regulator, transcriptional repressor for pyruvate dehydrogenase complex
VTVPPDASPRGSRVDRVVDALMDSIRTELAPGDRLDSLETLAATYGVSRSVVREAAARLSARSILEIRPGDGTYVREPDPSAASEIFSSLVRSSARDVRSVFLDVMEFRMAVEPEAARLAALRATPDELGALADVHQRGRRAADAGDRETLAITDVRLHETIYELSHNAIISQLLAVIGPLLREQRMRYPYSQNLTDRDDHDQIVRAILGRDPEEAARLSREHVTSLRSELTRLMFD